MPRGSEAKVKIKVTDDGSLKKLEKGSRQADRALKGTARTSSSGTKNFSKMSQGITGGLVPAYATLAANLFAITAVFGALKEAADLRVMREGMLAYAQSTGVAMQSISTQLQQVTSAQLDYGAAMKATATLTAAGFNTGMILEMGEAAKNASAALGHNFEDAFNRITKGIQKAEPELLDELGIVLRLDEATRKFSDQIGVNQKDLTLYQRTIAVHNEVIAQATAKYGQLDKELRVSGMNQLATAFENVKKSALEGIAPIAEFFANVLSKNVGLVILALGAFAMSMLKAAGIGDSLKAKTTAWVTTATTGATNARAKIAQYNDELARSKMSMDEIKGQAQGKLRTIVAPKTGGGKGAEMLRKGQFDELSKNKKILHSWKNTAKEHLLITKNMTDAEYQDFMQMVDDLLLEEEGFVQESKGKWEKFSLHAKAEMAEVGIGWNKVKSGMATGFAKIGSAMTKMLSIAGWAGMVVMLYKTISDGIDNLDKTVDAFLRWGTSVEDWARSKGMEDLANWLKNTNESLLKSTENWVKYKKEIRELKEIHKKLQEGADTMHDGLGEVRLIAEELRKEFEDGGETIELYIKRMKLMESINIGSIFKEATRNLALLIEKQNQYALKLAEMGPRPEKEGISATIPGYGLAFVESQASKDIQAEYDRLESLIRTAKPIDTTRGSPIYSMLDSMYESKKALKATGLSGPEMDAFTPKKTFNEIEGLSTKTEGYNKKVLDMLEAVAEAWDNLSESVIKPGKAFVAIKETTASYNRTFNQMKQKNMPGEWAKLGSHVGAVVKELEALDPEKTGKKVMSADLDKQTLDFLVQMGIQIDKNTNVQQALEEAQRRYNKLLEHAYYLTDRKLEREEAALLRVTGGVGGKLGGSLGAEIKHKEKLFKLDDQIAGAKDAVADLEKQKTEEMWKNDTEGYERKMLQLEIVRDSLIRNKQIEEESFKLSFKLVNTFQMSFETLFTEIAKGEKKIGDIFKDVTRNMLQQMAQLMAQMAAIAAMKAIFGPTLFGVPIGREGGVFKSPGYKSFAGGGVASGPSSGYLATLHGNEAVVPLGNDKAIPVKFDKSSSYKETNVTVNVSASGGQQTTTTKAGERERKLGQMIAAAVQGEILDQQRPGGILSPYGDGSI